MKLEDQVVSLELAKRLKELGVKQESYFAWSEYEQFDTALRKQIRGNWVLVHRVGSLSVSACAAFTVAELFDETIRESNFAWQIHHNLHTKKWGLYPSMPLPFEGANAIVEEKLADCLARLRIHLIEKGIVKV